MIADAKPYPAMKDSGVPWLGAVPLHWEIEWGKWMFRRMQRPIRDTDEVVTCFRDGIVTLRKNRRVRGFTEALKEIGYQGIRRGDLVIHGMDAFAGAIGVADSDGKGTPVYSVCEPRPTVKAQYYAYLLREMARNQWIQALAKGIRERSTDFRFDGFGSQPLAVPPFAEQAAIVCFLDHVDRRIRRYIRAKQRLITLLAEKKQAIIDQAVTRGLDPSVRLKPSGVEWLGDVPEHWDLRPAKWHFREADERSETGSEELLSVSHITGVTPRSEKNITMFLAASNAGYKLCRPGDLVINTMWAWMAALGVAKQAGIVSPSYAVYRPNRSSGLLGQYADLLLCTAPYKSEYLCRSTGIRSSRLRMYPEEFLRLRLLCPPLEEQRTIVDVVNKESADTRRAIELAHSELSLLSEYRTRLIADVVTGKLDVREAAARLPNEAEEPEPLEETDSLTDGEKELSDDLDAVPEEAEV